MVYESHRPAGKKLPPATAVIQTQRPIQTKTETKALDQLVKWKIAALAALAVASIDACDETIRSTPSVEVSTKENRYENNNSK
jgi:hypothetical protein